MIKRILSTFIFLAYIAILIKLMVFKDLPIIRIGQMRFNFGGTHEGPANLVPLKTILQYLRGEGGWLISVINLVGNIVLLLPIGFIAPLEFRSMTWKKALALALGTGLAIEAMQAVLHVGIFDVDDIILNGIGVMLGYWIFKVIIKMFRSIKTKFIIVTAILVIIVAVGIAYLGIAMLKSHFPITRSDVSPPSNGF